MERINRRPYKIIGLLLLLGFLCLYYYLLITGGFIKTQHYPTATPYPTSLAVGKYVKVTRVVDGDTVVVSINEKDTTVRLIGVNTPETVDPRRKVECFGKEASDYLKQLLTGKEVRLESDPSQAEVDRYGRLLRYIYLPDGTLVNRLIIENGYGYEYTYNTPYKFQEDFKSAQKQAMESKLGLWADNICVKM